ncbi:MAG: TolC family protein [Chitinophagaceae bacterium]|nr:TolC family protein [Chitinophagaceae bacterium]
MRRLFLVLSIVISALQSVVAQKAWTLEECAAYATANNISLKQSQLNAQLSEYTLTQSKLNLLPSVNASTGYYFNFGRTIDPTTNLFVNQNTQTNNIQLSVGWPLFNGFQRLNTVKQNEFSLLASQAATANTEQTIQLYVAGGFLEIVYAKENLLNADEQLSVSRAQMDRTKLLVNAGTLSQGSLYDIEAQVANDELAKVNAQNALDIAKLNLTQLMNLSEPLEVSVPDINMSTELLRDLNLTADSIYQTALRLQPVIKNAEYNLFSYERSLAIARGAQYPSLSFFGSLSTNYSDAYQRIGSIDTVTGEPQQIGYVGSTGEPVLSPSFNIIPTFKDAAYTTQLKDNFGQAFGFSLDIPIFNNWNTRTNISRSKINVQNAEYSLQSAKQQLQKDVETAYQDAVAAKNSYTAALKGVTALEKSFDDAQKKFNLGGITSLDYTTAKSNLTKAQSSLLQSKFRYIFKLKVLDLYQGKPLTLQ